MLDGERRCPRLLLTDNWAKGRVTMEPQLVVPGLHVLEFEIGQVYLWGWEDSLTVVDTGIAGSAVAILQAIEAIGYRPEQVNEIVLTHSHNDHRGGAAELVARTGARVIAHRADAPVIRGQQPETPPDLTEFERPFAEAIFPRVPPAQPVDVDREVDDGDATAGDGLIVGVPGHTPGSIALLVPELGALFTGDTIAFFGGNPILGPFNIDRARAIESVRKQARLEFEVACFGHGPPIVGGASRRIRALAEAL
jgi:glyoxylase-like metal-dependent hydrolase (beta-lactamase superfamily II)